MASRYIAAVPYRASRWHLNISGVERVVTLGAGIALVMAGMRKRSIVARQLRSAGTALALRGLVGWCPVYAGLGTGSRRSDGFHDSEPRRFGTETQRALSGPRGVHVRDRIVVRADIASVFDYWRDPSNLPRVIEHLESVQQMSERRSHWVARGPLGVRVEWDAEIINEIPLRLIAWRSLDGAELISAGSVRFQPVRQGVEVSVHFQYAVPAGKTGATVAWLLGDAPGQQLRAGLRRMRREIETRAGQPLDPVV